MQDLGSPAAAMIEPLLPSDPTLETLKLVDAWQPANAPQRLHGVWFDRAGREALLAIETHAAGFDPEGQQAVVDAIHAAFAAVRGDTKTRYEAYALAIQNGWLSVNDVRALEEQPAIADGDTYVQPLNLGPLNALGKLPKQSE